MEAQLDFSCSCGCGLDQPDPRLVHVLRRMGESLGRVTIHSGCRCAAHNRKSGGSNNSYHLNGMAADISVEGETPARIFKWLQRQYGDLLGLIEYRTFVHVDTRGMRVPYHQSIWTNGSRA